MVKYSAYWAGCENFGDQLTRDILFRGFAKIDWSEKCYAKIVGTGSILSWFLSEEELPKPLKNYPLYVFGTGLDDKDLRSENSKFIRKVKCYAVRGRYSLDFLKKKASLIGDSEVVLGDTGLLVSSLYDSSPLKKYDLGIIPHYVDKNDVRFVELQKNINNSIILDVQSDTGFFLKELSQCRYVISTAMHPLIACDALGIPNMWCFLPNANQVDMTFKFLDYYSAFGINMKPYVLDKAGLQRNIIKIVKDRYCVPAIKVKELCSKLEEARVRMICDMKKDVIEDAKVKFYLIADRAERKIIKRNLMCNWCK